MKSKNRTISKPVAPPKVVTNDAENLSARNISFVVQGQIQPETYTFLQALRRNFPEAELVLSTWRGKYDPCFRRITDKMIYCKDPGAVVCSYYREVAQWNNLNRQLVTTMAGLNAASRPFVAKVRTDFTLENSTLLSFWNRYPKRQSDALLFRHRIIVPSLYSRVYSDQPTALPVPFHGCFIRSKKCFVLWGGLPSRLRAYGMAQRIFTSANGKKFGFGWKEMNSLLKKATR